MKYCTHCGRAVNEQGECPVHGAVETDKVPSIKVFGWFVAVVSFWYIIGWFIGMIIGTGQ